MKLVSCVRRFSGSIFSVVLRDVTFSVPWFDGQFAVWLASPQPWIVVGSALSRVQFLAWYPWSGLARIFIFLRKVESFFSTRLGCGSKIPDDRDRDGSFTLLPFVSGELAGIVFLVHILFGVWSFLMVSAFAGSWCLCLSLAKAH